MVSKDDIITIAKRERLPLGIIEKDFILTFTLKKIYESELKNKLVFKGGTALHKLYLHKRMSIDLDFTGLESIDTDKLKKLIEDKEINSKIKDINETNNSIKIVLSYTSVLEYKNNIIIDISRREKPILSLINKKMKSYYFKDIEILTFQLEELIAEKIRAIMQRNKPRDYLDIYYMLGKKDFDIKRSFEISKQKLKADNDILDIKRIFSNLDTVRSLWEQDLREILPNIPNFDIVIKRLKKELSKLNFSFYD